MIFMKFNQVLGFIYLFYNTTQRLNEVTQSDFFLGLNARGVSGVVGCVAVPLGT